MRAEKTGKLNQPKTKGNMLNLQIQVNTNLIEILDSKYLNG